MGRKPARRPPARAALTIARITVDHFDNGVLLPPEELEEELEEEERVPVMVCSRVSN